MNSPKENFHLIIESAINSVKPSELIHHKVMLEGNHLIVKNFKVNLADYEKIFILGTGKASAYMAYEFEKLLGDKITDGIVSTKYGHSAPCEKIKIIESGHPIIDKNSLLAGEEVIKLASIASDKDLVICLLSGGGSALLEKLPDEITLPELQSIYNLLLNSGANIEEMNIVRRHLSKIKGGQLAAAIYPAKCVSLILSDVINDPLEAIAGGLTSPDPFNFEDALNILSKYNITDRITPNVIKYITEGVKRKITGTLIKDDHLFETTTNIIIGNNKDALINAKQKGEALGYNTLVYSDSIQGEAKEVGRFVATLTKKIYYQSDPITRPACLLFGGETTVTVKGNGKGGRNQELVLSALIEMTNEKFDFLIASIGTDGTDGQTDVAGAFVNQEIINKSIELSLHPESYLNNNDSYNFFNKVDGLVRTGPTGTNVMDIIVVLVN